MAGTDAGRRAARASLVRWCVAIAVFAGLVLLPCIDGMVMTADAGSPGMAAAADCAITAAVADAAGMACPASDMSGPGDPRGVLATCLVFLIAVVIAALGLRPLVPWTVPRVLIGSGAAPTLVAGRRAPGLAQLCVLRT